MEIEFDLAKSRKNAEERGLSFDRVVDFDFETARIFEDTRHDYPERRFIAIGLLNNRLHVLVFSPKKNGIRVISFRKANQREIKNHEKILTSSD
jgi:uncharacterized DUF497 family protein